MVYGDNKLYNVALVVPEMAEVKKWAAEQGISADSDEKLCDHAKVKEKIQSEVDRLGESFKGFERIKKVTLTPEDFTTQNDMLTPSLKVKRRVVWQRYKDGIESLYTDEAKAKGASASA
jgi:long-chain acyl-CoA synthetase